MKANIKTIIKTVLVLMSIQMLMGCETDDELSATETPVDLVRFVHEQMDATSDETKPVNLTNLEFSTTENKEAFDFAFEQ